MTSVVPPLARAPGLLARLRTDRGAREAGAARRLGPGVVLPGLAALLVIAAIWAIGHGAYRIAPMDVLRALVAMTTGVDGMTDAQQVAVLAAIRLPRVILAMLTGGALATAGVLMQGLFRNPLADPSLVGVSAGAALAAACVIVFDGALAVTLPAALDVFALPIAAFVGALAVTALVYRLGSALGVLSLPMMLLAGIAVNALAMAGVGFLSFIATDAQLRNMTFWNLGSLGGATWPMLLATGPMAALASPRRFRSPRRSTRSRWARRAPSTWAST
jgi:iron complex transport system permease protein